MFLLYGYFEIPDFFEENLPFIVPFGLVVVFYPPLLLASGKLYDSTQYRLCKVYLFSLMSVIGFQWYSAVFLVLSPNWRTTSTLSIFENFLSGDVSVSCFSALAFTAVTSILMLQVVCWGWVLVYVLGKKIWWV